ncbi:hypothetical protein VNO78_23232 [Psophocarpus tetragonolobus]|uniref:Uncharacterized protein n=1 Tax=Psophocarpus tetragonolobus TaxID=3891 RepID=A0AAN9S3N1_PSOTE
MVASLDLWWVGPNHGSLASQDLGIVLVKIELRLVPLLEFGGREGVEVKAADGNSEVSGLGLGIEMDVGMESVEGEERDLEEDHIINYG